MQLSKRLSALADLVSDDHILADVGCDHGYIPIHLLQSRRIPGAIAMDIGEGPLQRARENISACGLDEYIETRLSDGLAALAPGEVQTILISGMGGPLMERILAEGGRVLAAGPELVLQPQSDIPHFRMFLNQLEYKIIQEEMIFEDGKYYPMMKAVRGAQRCTPLEYRYGPKLLAVRDPVLREYLIRERQSLREIIGELRGRPGHRAAARIKELTEELNLSEEAWKSYDLQRDT